MMWQAGFAAVRTLLAITRRRGHLRDLQAIRALSTDERLELQQHDGHIGRWMTGAALVGLSGLAVWGWASGTVARARVHGLERDIEQTRVEVQQRTVERDQARAVAKALQSQVEAEKAVRGQCEARWQTAQTTCARVISDGARRSETRVRRDAQRKRGAVDAVTKPSATVGDAQPVPAPVADPRGLLLAIQADAAVAADAGTLPSLQAPEAASADPTGLRGRTDPGP